MPRSRGVYRRLRPAAMTCWGSSPLARGLRHVPLRVVLCGRIIPARAGFTGREIDGSPGAVGSSPLARGLPNQTGLALVGSGIIPARAGFTQGRTVRTRTGTDHPRSRGVYTVCDAPYIVVCGSSPLARGLQNSKTETAWGPRIIPARAGFTHRSTLAESQHWDHPRSRGVYVLV